LFKLDQNYLNAVTFIRTVLLR